MTFSFFLLAKFLQNFTIKDAINSNLLYFCQVYPVNFCQTSVVPILSKITLCLLDIVICPGFYLHHFTSTIKHFFELVLTVADKKNTKNTVIQNKYKKHSIFIKNADFSKK